MQNAVSAKSPAGLSTLRRQSDSERELAELRKRIDDLTQMVEEQNDRLNSGLELKTQDVSMFPTHTRKISREHPHMTYIDIKKSPARPSNLLLLCAIISELPKKSVSSVIDYAITELDSYQKDISEKRRRSASSGRGSVMRKEKKKNETAPYTRTPNVSTGLDGFDINPNDLFKEF